jgi:predicted dehydrogenase
MVFMEKVKVAVVGLGKMGLLHASILNTMPNVEVIALCDKSYILLRLMKKLFKEAKIVVDDLNKLDDIDINTVYVTTPIPSHFGIVRNLILQSSVKNIFVEKTLAKNWEQSQELCKLVHNSKSMNMVGYMKRFSVTFGKAKSILNDGVLGDIISFDAYAYSSDFSAVEIGTKNSSRGGSLSDLGSHVIDLALWLFGDFEIESALLRSIGNNDCEDSADFSVSSSAIVGRFNVSWCMNDYRMPSFGFKIKGSKGSLTVNDYIVTLELETGKPCTWFKHDLNDFVGFFLGESEFYREDMTFINSILTGVSVEPDFASSSRVDRVIDQVKREAKWNVE